MFKKTILSPYNFRMSYFDNSFKQHSSCNHIHLCQAETFQANCIYHYLLIWSLHSRLLELIHLTKYATTSLQYHSCLKLNQLIVLSILTSVVDEIYTISCISSSYSTYLYESYILRFLPSLITVHILSSPFFSFPSCHGSKQRLEH